MQAIQKVKKFLSVLLLFTMLVTTSACATTTAPQNRASLPGNTETVRYSQLERGNSATGQDFGDWVVNASKGLIKDAYVRDNNKLGVVLSPQVRPNEVKDLAKSLAQGFRKNFPNQDLKVLMYAPDKKLVLTALYDSQSKQVEFQQAS